MKRDRMRFGRASRDEPEINLIPFIDVLLVVLIFLMLSTTYSRFTEMQMRLPVADTETQREQPREVRVSVTAAGGYSIDSRPLADRSVAALAAALGHAADGPDSVVVISADAKATHQDVVAVMEAARRAGLARITFAAQSGARGS